MIPEFIAKLGFTPKIINVSTHKIDGSSLKLYSIVSARFLLQNSLGKVRFFEKTFLLADISIKVVLRILFLFFSNVDF